MKTEVIIFLFSAQILVEFVTYQKNLWKYRKILLFATSLLVGVSSGVFLVEYLSPWAALFIAIQTYRLFSLLRGAENRMNEKRLLSVCRRSSFVLAIYMILSVWVAVLGYNNGLTLYSILAVVLAAALLRLSIQILTLRTRLKNGRQPSAEEHLSDRELPTISVCIPARNETNDLADCINTLLQSDYPKLEIIVLDDCSHDDTSDIIKSFAHKGARFIKGKPTPKNWLAKNWAYKQLLDAANAKYVLFCGVDVRFSKSTLREIATILTNEKLSMVSILPRRPVEFSPYMIWQPMRYWRQLTFPKRLRNGYPPTLSTVWAADIDKLKSLGGFSAIKQTIRPEFPIAREFDRVGAYKFLINSPELDVSSIKSLKEQFLTAKRTRYPEYRKRVEYIFVSTLVNAAVYLLPYLALVLAIQANNALIIALSSFVLILQFFIHAVILRTINRQINLANLILLPLIAVCEMFVENFSMWSYEFSEVEWKDRNICLPVLKATPRLPNID